VRSVALGGTKAAGRVALVDDSDYDLVSQYRWHVWERPRNGPYAQANTWRDGIRTTVRMHVLISGSPLTDHRDRDGLNNQRVNLRVATDSQNSANRGPSAAGISAYKGVGWQASRNAWRARISTGRSSRFLGLFATEAAAARAYDVAARDAYGEFAYLNFPAEHATLPPVQAIDDAGEAGPERKRTP
jgi:hypothetical protein